MNLAGSVDTGDGVGEHIGSLPQDLGEPSPVLHLRNVTADVTHQGVQRFAERFGAVRQVVLMRQKNQALVEMDSVGGAAAFLAACKPGHVEIDGRRVYARYSRHKELSGAVQPSRILLIAMYNTQYDISQYVVVTPLIVCHVFSGYPVEKIIVLPKAEVAPGINVPPRVQALVQFETKEAAEYARGTLQGQYVALGDHIHFVLDLQYSKFQEINCTNTHTSMVIPKPSAIAQSLFPQIPGLTLGMSSLWSSPNGTSFTPPLATMSRPPGGKRPT